MRVLRATGAAIAVSSMLFAGVAMAAAAPVAPLPNSFVDEKTELALSWAIDSTAGTIEMEMTMAGSAFIAIGFGGSMVSAGVFSACESPCVAP